MRNLKRALSLTLASVMLLGMMVVGSSAAAGYDDVADTDNVEAIEVLQAIEVMVGDERGFGPERPVNRAEMAVVMGKLLSLDYNYYSTTCPFTDVYDWAQGWVGACAANGIVSGRGDGIYDPGSTVTAVEAASMLMRALGYFKYQNDYADGFEVATVRQGTIIGIFDGVGSSATEPMTRNQVAQMVLNALQSAVVEPDGNTINLTTPDGTVYTGKVNYVSVTSNKDYARAISKVQASSIGSQNDSPIVELGERLYNGELKLKTDDLDAFGRPSRTWEYKGKAIGTYMKKELIHAEYTVKVTGKELYELIGKATIEDKDYTFDFYIDGVNTDEAKNLLGGAHFVLGDLNKNNKSGVGATGNGVLTQVFVDSDAKEVTIAIINTYLAKATADYNEKKEEASLEVYAIDNKGDKNAPVYVKEMLDNRTDSETIALAAEDFAIAKDVVDGDFFLVNIAEGEIQIVKEPEVLSATTVTAFSKGDYVVTDGTQYDYAHAIEYDPEVLEEWTNGGSKINLKDRQYNLYLDTYGYVAGIDLVEDPDNYVFITGVDQDASNLAATNFKANAIFLDGTMQTIEVNGKKSNFNRGAWEGPLVNRWFTYTLNSTTNLYTVDEVNDVIRTKGSDGNYTVDADTVRINTTTANKNDAGSKWLHSNSVKLAQFATKNVDAVNPNTWEDYAGVQENENGEYKIGLKRVSLPAIGYNGRSVGQPFSLVYGNDATVYLTAKVETINSKTGTGAGKYVGVISDVDNVTVGVKNADLTTYTKEKAIAEADKNSASSANWHATDAAYGAYSLYKDNGYIIATVVVGEDSSAVKNLVYAHTSDVKNESYNSSTDEWTWTRKVIFNGEEVELTEVGDQLDQLDDMQQFNWYQVKLNGKGEVTSVQLAEKALDNYKGDSAYAKEGFEYADDIAKVQPCVLEKDTVLYERALYSNEYPALSAKPNAIVNSSKLPSLKNNVLCAETEAKTGFHVRDDVKAVLIQTRNNEKNKVFFEEGVKELEEMIKQLNPSETGTYNYEISAILTGGDASVVIIHDLNGDGYTPGVDNGEHKVTATYDKYHTFTVTINDGCTPNNVEIAAAIRYELETNHGGSNVSVNFKDNKVEEVSWTAPGGERVTLTVSGGNLTVKMFRQVAVNGKNMPITSGTTWAGLLTDCGTDFTKFPYVKTTSWSGTEQYFKYSDIANGVVDTDITTPNSNSGIDWIAVDTGYMTASGMNTTEAQAAIAEAKQATKVVGKGVSQSNGHDGKLPSGCPGAPAGVSVDVRNGTVYVSGTWAPGSATSYTWGSGTGWGMNQSLYNDATHFMVPFVFEIPEGAYFMERTKPDSMYYDYHDVDQDVMGFMVSKEDVARGYGECHVNWYADANHTILMGSTTWTIDLSGLSGGTTGTKIDMTKTTVSSGTTLGQIKALTPGAHVLSEIPTALNSDVHGTADQNMFFVYKTNDSNAGTTNTVATLTIRAQDGTVMYAETLTVSSNGAEDAGHVFYVQVLGDCVNQEQNYPMTSKGLPTGNYTWTVTGTNVIGAPGGNFTIGTAS